LETSAEGGPTEQELNDEIIKDVAKALGRTTSEVILKGKGPRFTYGFTGSEDSEIPDG